MITLENNSLHIPFETKKGKCFMVVSDLTDHEKEMINVDLRQYGKILNMTAMHIRTGRKNKTGTHEPLKYTA